MISGLFKRRKPCGWSGLVLWVPAVRSKADGLCCALQMLMSGQQSHNTTARFQQLKTEQTGFVGLFCFVLFVFLFCFPGTCHSLDAIGIENQDYINIVGHMLCMLWFYNVVLVANYFRCCG